MAVIKQHKKAVLTQSFSHLKSLYMLLIDFDQDYGAFPSNNTAKAVTDNSGSAIPLNGTSSNAYFRQIIAGGYVQSERIFCPYPVLGRFPDEDTTGSRALGPNECIYAYIPHQSTTPTPAAPVILAPLIPGTTTFDRKVLDGYAVYLSIDGVSHTEPIAKDGHVYIGGMDLFDPRQPFWGGKVPVIAYPE